MTRRSLQPETRSVIPTYLKCNLPCAVARIPGNQPNCNIQYLLCLSVCVSGETGPAGADSSLKGRQVPDCPLTFLRAITLTDRQLLLLSPTNAGTWSENFLILCLSQFCPFKWPTAIQYFTGVLPMNRI